MEALIQLAILSIDEERVGSATNACVEIICRCRITCDQQWLGHEDYQGQFVQTFIDTTWKCVYFFSHIRNGLIVILHSK